jgi:hypothetical protein
MAHDPFHDWNSALLRDTTTSGAKNRFKKTERGKSSLA